MGTERDFVVKKGLNVAEGITLGGHSFNDIDITSEATDAEGAPAEGAAEEVRRVVQRVKVSREPGSGRC